MIEMTSENSPKKHSAATKHNKLIEFVDAAERRRVALPHERLGQAYFNTLFEGFDPEFADEIRGGPLDPFYGGTAEIARLMNALRERWSA